MVIHYLSIPVGFLTTFESEIEAWARDPNSCPVKGFETAFGEVDLMKWTKDGVITVYPETDTDILVLEKMK